MSEYEEMSVPGTVGRVRSVNGQVLYMELRNGQIATVTGSGIGEFSIGDIVLVRVDENHIEHAPMELWPDESWVGVVRIKRDDITVVDASGRWRPVPTRADLDYREGNTIEATDLSGILRVLSEHPLKYVDFATVDDSTIAKFKSNQRSPVLSFDDFGGFPKVVQRARELIEVPLLYRQALSQIGARSIKGVLFTGPPGTGKTMLARIIANSTDAEFYEISGPEIFSKWYGQSEEILRRIFEHAADQHRAIIFFDEIDSVAGQRDDESHEASKRVVAQLLTLMDGFTPNDNVIVIAATNRPQDIDIALRRPGRFDWEVHFSLPDIKDREDILEKTSRGKALGEQLPYRFIAHSTDGWSAADLTAIWTEAALLAVKDNRPVILAEDFIGGFERVRAQRQRIGLVLIKGTVNETI